MNKRQLDTVKRKPAEQVADILESEVYVDPALWRPLLASAYRRIARLETAVQNLTPEG